MENIISAVKDKGWTEGCYYMLDDKKRFESILCLNWEAQGNY